MIRLHGIARFAGVGMVIGVLCTVLTARSAFVASMDPTLTGQPVAMSSEAEPVFGHGYFRLTNPQNSAFTVGVKNLWLAIADARHPLSPTTIWDRANSRNLDPTAFGVEANSTLEFYVSFPQESRPFEAGDTVGVILQLEGEGTSLEAFSPFESERRLR